MKRSKKHKRMIKIEHDKTFNEQLEAIINDKELQALNGVGEVEIVKDKSVTITHYQGEDFCGY